MHAHRSQAVGITVRAPETKNADRPCPFELLDSCHEKMERMLCLLERLAVYRSTHGVDETVREAARDLMRYFDLAAPLHHEDEERHVFPLLLSSADPALAALAHRLGREHQILTQQWTGLRADLQRLAEASDPSLTAWQPQADWAAFAALQRQHLQQEERAAYPAARALISDQASAQMQDCMMQRRGHPGTRARTG